MAELILELLSEEIPARFQALGARALKEKLEAGLQAQGISFDSIETFVSPRRLVASGKGISPLQPDTKETRKGPRVGAPDKALEGFLRGAGVTLAQCRQESTPKGDFWVVDIENKGKNTADLLPGLITGILESFPWPKSMRWGGLRGKWVRPLRGIVALLDGQVLDLSWQGVKAGFVTYGHRTLCPQPIPISTWASYGEALNKAYVMLDQQARLYHIQAGVARLAQEEGAHVPDHGALLQEVTGLVEYPWFLVGSFDKKYLTLPPQVLETTLRVHQRYFLLSKDGLPTNKFIVVTNMPTHLASAAVAMTHGYEKVLHARLEDAAFYWQQDQKIPLAALAERLKKMLFHQGLGTLWEKRERLAAVMEMPELQSYLREKDISSQEACQAALLCKADLGAGMVGEFPELQGIMGGHYARLSGESAAVAAAITTQYMPSGPDSPCPDTPLGLVLSLVDKIDTLVGFFAKGIIPSGSKDPFALRRAATGMVRLMIEGRLPFDCLALLSAAYEAYVDQGFASEKERQPCLQALTSFIKERLKQHFKDRGADYKVVEAVLSGPLSGSLYRLNQKMTDLSVWVKTPQGTEFLQGYRRICNILKDAKPKGPVLEELLVEKEEQALWLAFQKAHQAVDSTGETQEQLAALSPLAPPIRAYFEAIMVNDPREDIKENRHSMLWKIKEMTLPIGDFGFLGP